jgi:phage tail-like protein
MASSAYLQHLPEAFRTPPAAGIEPFLGRFLKIFEALLSGRADAMPPGAPAVRGLEDILGAFVDELDPAFTTVVTSPDGARQDSPFLAYLASWVALTLDQNWDLDRKRRWLQRIVLLYQRRGTRAGLEEYLSMFVGDHARISEPPGGFTLAVPGSTTLAVDTFLAGAPAYYFRVGIEYAFGTEPFDLTGWLNIRKGTRAIIDLEKPAHTYYTLDTRTPGVILAVHGHAVVGRETLIWQNSRPL